MVLLSHGKHPPRSVRTCLKFLKGTNWTMSRSTGSPLGDLRIPSSPSSICMSLKSALPTPTMMTDMGRWEACTMASRVSAMSVMTPSVRISRMKYCWGQRPGSDGGWRGGGDRTTGHQLASGWLRCTLTPAVLRAEAASCACVDGLWDSRMGFEE